MSYPKAGEAWTRSSTEGIQAALADILLLSSCPVLVGTFYSSYSETAKLMGKGFYVQVRGRAPLACHALQTDASKTAVAYKDDDVSTVCRYYGARLCCRWEVNWANSRR